MVRDVGVDQPSGLGTVFGVHMTSRFRVASGTESLSVRGGCGAVSPVSGEGMFVLGIDEFREAGSVGFISNMGGLVAVQLGVGNTSAGL